MKAIKIEDLKREAVGELEAQDVKGGPHHITCDPPRIASTAVTVRR